MKKVIEFLKTTLTKTVKTTVGYTIAQIIFISITLISLFSISKEYFDYRVEMEELNRFNEKTIEVYECYMDKYLFKEDTLKINN